MIKGMLKWMSAELSTGMKIFLVIYVAVFATFFYFTPHLDARGMQAAVKAGDAHRMAGYVDFPALRASMNAAAHEQLAKVIHVKGAAGPRHPVGDALAAAFLGPMIDAMITPERIALALQGRQLDAEAVDGAGGLPSTDRGVETSMGYETPNRFAVTVTTAGSAEEPVTLVFGRRSLFTWKVVAIRFPA